MNVDAKTQEEINYLREQIKTERRNRFLNTVKAISIIIGSIILFIIIKQPESAINRQNSEETINRERAQLVLQILREDNPVIKSKALKIIRATYPSISGVLDSIEIGIEESTQIEIVSMYKNKLEELETKKKIIETNLNKSKNQTEKKLLENNLQMVLIEINKLKSLIEKTK